MSWFGTRRRSGLRRRLAKDAKAATLAAIRLQTPVLATESGFKPCRVADAVAETVNEVTLFFRNVNRAERASSP